MFKNFRFFFIQILFISFSICSQELPPINVYYTKDYGGENQNWGISQSDKGFIYVANNKGLLEFNGASWQLYETPNETIVRSVKAYKEKIFTGFYMGFGFWERNDIGKLQYISIVKNQNIKMLEDEQIWSIVEIDGFMLFKSLQRIYLYNLESRAVKFIDVENRINSLSKVDEVIYFHEKQRGLFKIENGAAKLVSNHEIVKDNFIVEVFKKDDKLLVLTQKNGFYYLENEGPIKWKTALDNLLTSKTVYSVRQLEDKGFAIGTISDGLIYLKENGELNYQINQNSGLINNTVLSVMEDSQKNIWLGLDNGIVCINNTSPFKMSNKNTDFLGTIYTSIVYEDNIYFGTNQGLFYRGVNSDNDFEFVENTQGQVWSLKEIDNQLFCGHDSGTFIIKGKQAESIFRNQGTWEILKINENTIIQGCYEGLYVLKKQDSKWKLSHKIKGFRNSSKMIELADNNRIFVNHEYKGVFKLTLDKDYKEVTKIDLEKSLEKGIHSSILKYQNEILYANKKGVYIYDKELDSFKKDSIYSKLVSEDSFISANLVNNSSTNKLWSFSLDHIKYLSPGKLSNQPEINKIAISETIAKAASGYENIINIGNEIYLIGTSDGYIKVDLKNLTETANFKVHINEVHSFVTDLPRNNLKLSENASLDYNNNNLEFYYSVSNFNKILTTKYQYQLEGFNKTWSAPLESNSILFKNLQHGSYTLKVRAIIGDIPSSNEASYTFKINKPWYISNPLIVFYILLSIFALYSVHIASKRYYKKQKEELLEKTRKESELKELETSQEIIKLNNDKLRSDIESKNRELATSTMSIIKKNEFLNSIKTELVSEGKDSIHKVVKIIDKNLNNTDDWKMFQEAFNNADKNFLKKIKTKHPQLTPNDLRLCAYLRLNLSSKEIAPLLNISPRSVEVKRYRLRKKMDLDHEANLTNYIIEV
ncbi:MAG: triple tyrosine motif-containing protein [Polaribacter sp.]|uniref:helix-turn-helix and ligand-binding sensor domain-containing protein n=1 Tax=Polaribacter sp. TaxID=1920175 RepID=UPI003BAE64EE